jgi:hypothetical protein
MRMLPELLSQERISKLADLTVASLDLSGNALEMALLQALLGEVRGSAG